MVDKRSLRSNKPDSSSSTNGDKAAPSRDSSTSNSQGKAAPTRSTSTRAKAAATKKGTATPDAKGSDEENVRVNGVDPVENGVNGTSDDIDMADDASDAAKKSKSQRDKDGDEEMTVVVPPSKGSNISTNGQQDRDDDVTMEGVQKEDDDKGKPREEDPVAKTVTDIKGNFSLLERAVAQFDARFSLRALRSISSVRKRLTADIIATVISDTYPSTHAAAKTLLATLGKTDFALQKPQSSEMELDAEPKGQTPQAASKPGPVKEVLPEVDIYLSILVQIHFLDTKAFDAGAKFSTDLVHRIHSLNRRTLDSLAARVYFYYSLFHEHLDPLPPSPLSPVVSIRQQLLAALRTAVLRKDTDTQATVTTSLLRNYLSTSHVSQADLLVSHTQFPPAASNNQIARFLYYLGRIRAIQLSYTEAQEHLTGATRKSPTSASAAGFYQASTKLLIVVELLMGDIPDRAIFRQPSLERALQPYFALVQAVRGGVKAFSETVETYSSTYRRDGTYTLILRLKQNVIKTGIRMMSLSYSRISLRDICLRLELTSEESAEYIVAKAIRDGVIEATLDHERGFMKSKEIGDIYATREPGEAFHDRIRACLGLHDESVKAMRYPMNQHRLELKNAQEARERERELAKEIQEGDIDEEDAGGDYEGMIDPPIRLRRAIHLNDLLLVKRITRNNPKHLANPDFADKGNTSLHLACKLGFVDIAAFLIDIGHEDTGISRNVEGDTPLMAACDGGHEAVVRLLLQQFARCVSWKNKAGMDALMLASRNASSPTILSLLLSPPISADPNAQDGAGNSALHYASAYGQLKALRMLLAAGASPGLRNWHSWDPVSYSATVQAEVYFRGLVAEGERRAGRSAAGGGGVRLVTEGMSGSTGDEGGSGSPRGLGGVTSTGEREGFVGRGRAVSAD
ncbi:MAG: 26S proteasome non-ATPase regulatory subunit [Piccolia ochrophora]|nr:MAG: 26S proteasome non-ATPase regulatory subunit [Piccolia ochrophora]